MSVDVIYPCPVLEWEEPITRWMADPEVSYLTQHRNWSYIFTQPYLIGLQNGKPVGMGLLKPQGKSAEYLVYAPNNYKAANKAVQAWAFECGFERVWGKFELNRIDWKGDLNTAIVKIERWVRYFGWNFEAIIKSSDGTLYVMGSAKKER